MKQAEAFSHNSLFSDNRMSLTRFVNFSRCFFLSFFLLLQLIAHYVYAAYAAPLV